MNYTYQKQVNPNFLKVEIENSAITVALDYIEATSTSVTVVFKATLSTQEEAALASLVEAHIFQVDPSVVTQVSVVSQPEQQPFAAPTFRTKWDATPDTVTMEANSTQTIDYILPEERYVHGGEILYSGSKLGDWVSASIVDSQGLIPEPYRAALAEDYPTIATYITRHYIPEGVGFQNIQTYPLNAKVTQGLVLRVTIRTCAKSGTREFGINYYLTKKLA